MFTNLSINIVSQDISTKYNPSAIEEKWYKYWEEKNYFSSKPDEREPYVIVMPPPNVTGVLHMGHMLNNTIQDVLIRRARKMGKNACWVPGTDHASIATEAKVVKMLRDRGIKKSDLSREEFLQYAWQWKEEYGGIILQQLRKLGASCDWGRTAFTMDEVRSKAVNKVFVDLYRKGKLYRKKRMVHWDPEAKTVLSNEEVIYQVEQSRLYYVKYQIADSNDFIIIATTRPETIPGDTAIAVNPEDKRYAHLKGKYAIVPIIGRKIPIIFDDYVDSDFGTGALKVTPAHDMNDFEIGERHQLEIVDVFNDDGTMSPAAQVYVGLDRFEVRKLFSQQLQELGCIEKIENYSNNVGRSERTNAVVEPRLSLQWYVDMKALAATALEAVENDDIRFFPLNQKNLYRHWMENIKDWCISRQLWWGHRIPAWYYKEEIIVAEDEDQALSEAKKRFGDSNISISDLVRDGDVLDTWFSSWLWPISVFNGFESKDELDYYYPTSVLVTGWDIIFLWVARMIMAGFEWTGSKPFRDVYFTGMVRDKLRKKMSKQLGNSPDALELIKTYGADGVRFGMLSCSPAGGDLLFDEKLCEQGRNFCNKLWNVNRLIEGWNTDATLAPTEAEKVAMQWIKLRFKNCFEKLQKDFEQYRLSEALISLYTFIWDDFCSWYLEAIKPEFGKSISTKLMNFTKSIFKEICSVLHPFMPFITEELYNKMKSDPSSDCIISPFPIFHDDDSSESLVAQFDMLMTLTSSVRDLRNQYKLKAKAPLSLYALKSEATSKFIENEGMVGLALKFMKLEKLELADTEHPDSAGFLCGREKFFIILDSNQEEDQKKYQEFCKEIDRLEKFSAAIATKLANDDFVNKAPGPVVDLEKKKYRDALDKIKLLKEEVEKLKIRLGIS